MTLRIDVTLVVEGTSDESVARRLIEHVGLCVGHLHIKNGKARLDDRLPSYNRAARYRHYLVLRDLNNDAACAPELVKAILPSREPKLALRIAVREVEAWLLADTEAVAHFLGLPRRLIPSTPDTLADPKRTLVELARKTRNRDIRHDMTPRRGSTATVGPAYTDRIAELALLHWKPDRAAGRSPSLSGCIRTLRRWRTS